MVEPGVAEVGVAEVGVAEVGVAEPGVGRPAAQAWRPVLPLECAGIVVVRHARTLLDGVDVRIAEGGTTVLMGANGAGKSLLLRVLAGLVAPDRGQVRWAGRSPGRESATRIGFVFQKPVMLRRSVLRNVTYALAAAGVPRRAREERARALLTLAALDRLEHAPARVLSGGEQQRLAVVRALATEPEVLLLDEPTSSLDPASTLAIERLVDAARTRGARVLLVTHDVGQGRRLADDVLFMHRGRIVERALATSFFESPASEPARAFLEGRIVL
jgi:tungstate transport system ATP-binding protein